MLEACHKGNFRPDWIVLIYASVWQVVTCHRRQNNLIPEPIRLGRPRVIIPGNEGHVKSSCGSCQDAEKNAQGLMEAVPGAGRPQGCKTTPRTLICHAQGPQMQTISPQEQLGSLCAEHVLRVEKIKVVVFQA